MSRTINELIEKIKTSVFGKDVRQSICDGIATINEKVEENANQVNETKYAQNQLERIYNAQIAELANQNPQLPEIVDARQGFDTIGAIIKRKIFRFINLESMKKCLTLIPEDVVQTLGYYEADDGGAGLYRIVNDPNLVEDGGSVINLTNGYKAKLVLSNEVNVKQFGSRGDGITDDLQYINRALNYIKKGQILYFPDGIYLTSNVITINKEIKIKGTGTINLGGADFNAITITANNVTIDGLSFTNTENYTPSTLGSGNIGDAIRVLGDNCIIKNCTIENYIAGIVYGGVGLDYNKGIIENNNIKIKGLNTGFINDGICSLADNVIIKNNVITNYDETNNRGCIICDINALHNIVENNICLCNGICAVGVHSEQSSNTIIRGNNIYNPRLLGVTISTGCIVSKNYIETPHTEVSGYTLDHCAISLYGGPKNCIVDGNLINCFLDTKMAIRGNGKISGTKIINNSIYSTENHTPSRAIYLHVAEDTVISKNSIILTCGVAIVVNAKNNIISENIIKEVTTKAIDLGAAINTLIIGNRILKSPIGIDVFNSTNSNIIGNIIGNEDDVTTTGIITRNTGGNKFVNCSDNNFINVTTEYDRNTYGGLTLIKTKNEIDFIDTTLNTRKKITIDNGSIKIS